MKRAIALIICCTLILSGCSTKDKNNSKKSEPINETIDFEQLLEDSGDEEETARFSNKLSNVVSSEENQYTGLDDPRLLNFIENDVYREVVSQLDSDKYYVHEVKAVYLSKEYIEELAYNSQSNVFFGYTLDELEKQFGGQRYIFTTGDDGETKVVPLEEVHDDTYEKMLKNVAIGGGIILVCVTVSLATGGIAPAVSVVFAFSAKGAATLALSGAVVGGISSGLVRGYQTRDMSEALKSAGLGASEGFKIGAMIGAVKGGAEGYMGLQTATKAGLKYNEAALIQKETKWSPDIISHIHSMDEYQVYKNADITPVQLSNGRWVFTRDIDWNYVDSKGRTNIQRVLDYNIAPADENGVSYELHHLAQDENGPLAILKHSEHHSSDNFNVLHYAEEGKDITEEAWAAQKKEIWELIEKLAQEAK